MTRQVEIQEQPELLRLVVVTFDRFVRQEMTTYAAALAYRGLLAMFPFVIFVIAVVNTIDMWQLFGFLADWASTEPDGRMPRAIRQWLVLQVRQQSQGAVISIGAVASIWAVAAGARVLRRALNVAGSLEETQTAWRRLVISLMIAPLLAGVVLVVLTLFLVTGNALLQVARWFEMRSALIAVWDWLRWPAGVCVAALVTLAIYRLAPAQRLGLRVLLPGAVTTALIWAVASLILPRAVSGVLQFGVTYGGFSAAIILLVYLYVSAAALLFGAELNAVCAGEPQPLPQPALAVHHRSTVPGAPSS